MQNNSRESRPQSGILSPASPRTTFSCSTTPPRTKAHHQNTFRTVRPSTTRHDSCSISVESYIRPSSETILYDFSWPLARLLAHAPQDVKLVRTRNATRGRTACCQVYIDSTTREFVEDASSRSHTLPHCHQPCMSVLCIDAIDGIRVLVCLQPRSLQC